MQKIQERYEDQETKIALSLLLALSMALVLCACGQAEPAKHADETIASIGEVTDSSLPQIEKAEAEVAALSEKEAESLNNLETLKEARSAYNELLEAESKRAFTVSKDAYDEITKAYEITNDFGVNVYEVWRQAIYEKNSVLEGGIEYLSEKLSLTKDELYEGAAYAMATGGGSKDWNEIDDTEKDVYRAVVRSDDSGIFSFYDNNNFLFSFCIKCVVGAYVTNGEIEEAQKALDNAKSLMKELSEKYSDYEHYPNLKGYYTTTKSFFDFCQSPTGSFNQLVDTMNNYRNAVRDYKADLDYIFE